MIMNDLILLNNYIIIPLYIITKKPVKSSEKAGQERDKMVCWLKTKYTGVRYLGAYFFHESIAFCALRGRGFLPTQT